MKQTTKSGEKRMPKTRLNEGHRRRLYQFAKEQLAIIADAEFDIASAESAMKKYVLKRIKEEFPPKDMEILARYDKTHKCSCIRVSLDGNNSYVKEFELGEEYLSPERYNCHLIRVEGPVATKWFELVREKEMFLENRRSDYYTLIYSTRYFEDVLEAFPAAAQLSESIGGPCTALSVVDSPILERIREDSIKLGLMTINPN